MKRSTATHHRICVLDSSSRTIHVECNCFSSSYSASESVEKGDVLHVLLCLVLRLLPIESSNVLHCSRLSSRILLCSLLHSLITTLTSTFSAFSENFNGVFFGKPMNMNVKRLFAWQLRICFFGKLQLNLVEFHERK